MTPDAATLLSAMTASWPPEAEHRIGPWTLRQGPGGGNRVSCAVADGPGADGPEADGPGADGPGADGPVTGADLAPLVAAAGGLGQPGLVMVRPHQTALDALLADAGWRMGEEVVLYLAPAGAFDPAPVMTTFAHWPPLAVQRLIWAEDGIGPGKLAVMDRAAGPKAAVLGRSGDRPAGTGFVAMSGEIAFLHALCVVPGLRRQGTADHILRAAAVWAQGQGARWLALAVTRGNVPARALYAGRGMQVVGHYHYRRA